MKVIITTDHGTIRVKRPFKIIGDKNVIRIYVTSREKHLGYEGDKGDEAPKPERFFLPKQNVSTSYVFAIEDQFLLTPTITITSKFLERHLQQVV